MVYESYVSRAFLNDCKKCQEIKVFNALYSNVDHNITDISQETFNSALNGNEGVYIGPVTTYIKEDSLIVKLRDDNIRNYFIVYFMYGKNVEGDNAKNLAFAIKIKDENSTELEDFADNFITFDMKGFDLSCYFTAIEKTTGIKNPPIHEHITSSIDSEDENPLIDIIDLNKKIFNKLSGTVELSNPSNPEYLGMDRITIRPDAKVTKSQEETLLNVSGDDFINNDINLSIVNNNRNISDDILI